ncbi:MAG: glutathione S-transferase C-terminal domain-containing protein [Candidatus Methylumidiphilus sp.]
MASTETVQAPARLITFPPSGDCENSRWLLDYYAINYQEERHTLPFLLFTVKLNHGNAFPLYLDKNLTINGLRPMIDHFDGLAPNNKKLIPEGQEEETNRLWTRYNSDMALATVYWSYFHLLKHWKIMFDPLSIGTPGYERFSVKYLYPPPAGLLWLFKLSQQKADESLTTLRTVFAEVSQRLSDGRPYLLGDRMTIADIAFAASGAPLVLPLGYGGYPGEKGPLPSFEDAPPEFQSVVKEMLQTPAGEFVLRMYREERYR